MKFKKDESIWIEFFNFLIKHKCHNILNKEIGFCLVNHPNNLDFWRIAAYNEFEYNSNSLAARNILQKCLRLNRDNIDAHLEYFIFELKFVEKVVDRRNILTGEDNSKKLSFINGTEDNIPTEEKNETSNSGDDVINLKVPEIIWIKTLLHFQNKDTNNCFFSEINFKFLSALMKYGKKTNYKHLKNKILQKIKESKENDLDTDVKIIYAKLEKYDNKNLLKKSIIKFQKLAEINPQRKNFILSQMITLLEEKNRNFSSEEKEKINDYIMTNISSKIDYQRLIQDISTLNYKESLTIIKYLYENLYYTGNKYKSFYDFDTLIEESTNKSFSNKQTNEVIISEIIQIYWKFMVYNKNEDAEIIFTKLSNKLIQSVKGKQNVNMIKYVLKSLCILLEEEIKLFSYKTLNYFNQVENILKQSKTMNQEVLKDIYKTLIEIVYVRFLTVIK